jgi:hypothetical protein
VGHARTVVVEYKDLLARTEDLVREFQPAVAAGTVIRTVTRYRTQLLRSGVRSGLAQAAENLARTRLRNRLTAPAGAAAAEGFRRGQHRRPVRGPVRGGVTATPPPAHGSAGSGSVGQPSRRAPSTAALSANR